MQTASMGQSYEDLKNAFSEEAALAFRYLYFAKVAEIEGHEHIARICREVAEGGVCNAHGSADFLRQLGADAPHDGVGDTEQNLRTALALESRGHSELYPNLAARARSMGLYDIASWFETVGKLKQHHARLLREHLGALKPLQASGQGQEDVP
jgi:rubrerythrin